MPRQTVHASIVRVSAVAPLGGRASRHLELRIVDTDLRVLLGTSGELMHLLPPTVPSPPEPEEPVDAELAASNALETPIVTDIVLTQFEAPSELVDTLERLRAAQDDAKRLLPDLEALIRKS